MRRTILALLAVALALPAVLGLTALGDTAAPTQRLLEQDLIGGSNPWLQRRVLNIAHQGGAHEAPSDTLYALKTAVAKGADVLEHSSARAPAGITSPTPSMSVTK